MDGYGYVVKIVISHLVIFILGFVILLTININIDIYIYSADFDNQKSILTND